jgi:hypothetical protein
LGKHSVQCGERSQHIILPPCHGQNCLDIRDHLLVNAMPASCSLRQPCTLVGVQSIEW